MRHAQRADSSLQCARAAAGCTCAAGVGSAGIACGHPRASTLPSPTNRLRRARQSDAFKEVRARCGSALCALTFEQGFCRHRRHWPRVACRPKAQRTRASTAYPLCYSLFFFLFRFRSSTFVCPPLSLHYMNSNAIQISGSMERVRVFMQHITQTADQLVTVVATLAFTVESPPEMCQLRIGCCPGPFNPAVGSTVGDHSRPPLPPSHCFSSSLMKFCLLLFYFCAAASFFFSLHAFFIRWRCSS